MAKRVVLELRGNLQERGFYVTLRLEGVKTAAIVEGALPSSPELYERLNHWQQDYRGLAMPSRALKPINIRTDGRILPLDTCVHSAQLLLQCFQQWLRADSFRSIDLQLRQSLMPDEAVEVVIRTADRLAQSLPWHQWEFFETYGRAEVSISSAPVVSPSRIVPPLKQVNVLAVLGDRTHIDIESDRHMLNQLPNAQVTVLVEPSHQQLHDTLYDRPWQILFFAGHSQTQADGQGILQLNPERVLELEEIHHALRNAIQNGLQLAIFNSCDGLGLAHALDELQLPHLVVMREPVPDPVAQQFLKHFLSAFAQGRSLHLSVRAARERLQGMEKICPCASWLPVIYQHPDVSSLTWMDLMRSEHSPSVFRVPTWGRAIGIGALVSCLVMGGQALGLLQAWELKAFDLMMTLRPNQDIPDPRILVIAVGEEDIQYQENQGMVMQGSLSDEALLQLLQKLAPHQPNVIGLDILHPFPFSPELETQLEQHPLVTICRAKNVTSEMPSIPPPPHYSEERVTFNNVPLDLDGTVRRQFLGRPSKDPNCPVQEAFGFHIVLEYLKLAHSIELEWVPVLTSQGLATPSTIFDKYIRLGAQIFTPLDKHAGGYQLSRGEAGGYQVLINYRAAHPEKIHLKNVLSGSLDSQLAGLVRDRIILIGVVTHNVDTHITSYSRGSPLNAVPGVVVHSHMISQLISAALGEQALLSWWPNWLEHAWLLSR